MKSREYIDCINQARDKQMEIICEDIIDLEETSDIINKVERGYIYDLNKL